MVLQQPSSRKAEEEGRLALLRASVRVERSEALPRISEPFFTTRFIGLGLAEVAGAIRRHNGAVLVQSGPCEGTRMTLLVPVEGA